MPITLDTQNLQNLNYTFNYNYTKLAQDLYQKSKHFAAQGFVDLPFDNKVVKDIRLGISKFKDTFDTILVLGIGGSMLGVQTIVDSLYYEGDTEVICLDNIDPFVIQKTAENLDLDRTLFLVQTKSGGTPETLAQFFYFKELCESLELHIHEKFIFVTDPKDGFIRNFADIDSKITSFEIPSNVGGRFCVLTPMGLLISELLGLDSTQMLQGAGEILKNHKPLCMELAQIQVNLYSKGIDQNVLMPYSSRLATLSKWYIQLLSESIGKEFDSQGKKINIGITPIPAVGATDQHSQAQLFKEGPNNKLIMLIEVKDHQVYPIIGNDLPAKFKYLEKRTFNDLIDAELIGTKQSLTESHKPNLTLSIDRVNEYNLGALFMLFELSVAYIGELLNINAFDQPGVERAKILAQEILSSKK